jgi:hypothetical protein
MVSGTISLPSQGFFSPFPHGTGSLSVRRTYLALRDGPRSFSQGFSCPAILRYQLRVRMIFVYVTITLYGLVFQRGSTNHRIGNSTVAGPTTPDSPEGETGLGCCDFARHYFRNRGFFLFLQVLRWFTSLGLLVPDYGFIGPYGGFTSVGFPIRTSPGYSLLAALRGLSQLATSFIAVFCQGIHHAPLVA